VTDHNDNHDDAMTRDKNAQEQGRGVTEAGRAGGTPTTRSLGECSLTPDQFFINPVHQPQRRRDDDDDKESSIDKDDKDDEDRRLVHR
jgi:hypothetical protein